MAKRDKELDALNDMLLNVLRVKRKRKAARRQMWLEGLLDDDYMDEDDDY